jgi:heme-degrading monooxygenase HmoA
MRQKGYVSGETLVNFENKREVAVVSTWSDFEDFNAWLNSRERAELENKLTPYLEAPAKVGCFLLGADAIDEMFEKIVHDSEAAS